MNRTRTWVIAAVALLVFSAGAYAQFGRSRGVTINNPDFNFPKEGEFHFVRLEYTDDRGGGFRFGSRGGQNGWWAQDWPDAENHFTFGIKRLTRIDIAAPVHLGLTDPEIFEYPWLYSTQNNYMTMSEEEVEKLREYLNRGGFLMTDDMYDREGERFYQIVSEVYPGVDVESMSEADPMMHVHYSIEDKDRTFIPGERHLDGRGGIRPDGTPRWEKVSDKKGHVVMALNVNTDMGDAWEYADASYYPAEMTTLAYHYGINYIIYSMTH
jgi:hypothetical protein